MNPYLEQEAVWQDFHNGFIYAAKAELARKVEPSYIVKSEEYVFIHELSADERKPGGRPDLTISKKERPGGNSGAGTAVTAPAYVQIPSVAIDAEHHSFLAIRDRQNLDLVTVIELLSPSNKSGADRSAYLDKRQRYLLAGVNLVELDFLRGGKRLPLDSLGNCDYYALVARRDEQPRGGVWTMRLRDPLPTIPIPLRGGDADVTLDLQAVLHRVYDEARYENYIYLTPPQPPLTGEDADWTRQFLPM